MARTRPNGYVKTIHVKLDELNLEGDSLPENPRLTASMATQGQIDEIVVYSSATGGYNIVDGRQRVKSAKALDWQTVRADIYEAELQALAAIGLATSIRRSNPVADAAMLKIIAGSMTEQDIWHMTGLTKAQRHRLMAIGRLPAEVKAAFQAGQITKGGLRALCRLEKKPAQLSAWQAALEMDETGKKRGKPTTAQVNAAVRKVRGELQPTVAVPLPLALTSTDGAPIKAMPDPVTTATAVRSLAEQGSRRYGPELEPRAREALLEAAAILEGM